MRSSNASWLHPHDMFDAFEAAAGSGAAAWTFHNSGSHALQGSSLQSQLDGTELAAIACIASGACGRYKDDGNGNCYWDNDDAGADQCDPNAVLGRCKVDGESCVWDGCDDGADQCECEHGESCQVPLVRSELATPKSASAVAAVPPVKPASSALSAAGALPALVAAVALVAVRRRRGNRADGH